MATNDESIERKAAMDEETIIDPARPIVDPHHHLRDPAHHRYLFAEFLKDITSGHNIVATVVVECGAMWRAAGPAEFRPVGETEFFNGVAAMFASGKYGAARGCAGIVGTADLRLGSKVRPVLEAQVAAGGGRFRGIRVPAAWDEAPALKFGRIEVPQGLLLDNAFREGLAEMKPFDLSLDAHIYFTQLPEMIDLARAFPDTRIIANHYGGLLGIGPYAGRHEEVFAAWLPRIRELARCPNVFVKLGGIRWAGLPIPGVPKGSRPNSRQFAEAWRPYIDICVEAFGPERCMFESNFPSEIGEHSYVVLWNAFKRAAEKYSETEKTALFSGTAARAYRLSLPS